MSHAPKQRALEAYAEGLLSPLARTRVEAHLALCTTCRAGLSAVRAYALLREQAAAESAPAASWERLEQALERAPAPSGEHALSTDARAPEGALRPIGAPGPESALRPPVQRPRAGRVIALAWPVLALAATFVIAWLGVSGAPDAAPQPSARAPAAPPVLPLTGRVTLIAGAAHLAMDDRDVPLDLHSEIREGAVLVTGRDAELHVALGPGTGFALGPQSRLRVAELRTARTRLELVVGSVANQVAPLAQKAEYRVLTGDITASVRGTRFVVEQRDGVRVSVHEGLVEVTRGDQVLALLSPGQSFEAPERARARAHDVQVHALGRAFEELHALHIPPLPQLRTWRVDGASLSAQGELAMRMPPGIAQLSFEDMRGQVRTIEIDVNEAETRVDPLWLAKLVAPKDPPRSGHLPPEQIAAVIKAGLEPLRRCYERSLRTRPALEARLTLAVRVGADGRVQRAAARADAGELPHELEQCIAREAGQLLFPKPEGGGSMSFEVPINLKAK